MPTLDLEGCVLLYDEQDAPLVDSYRWTPLRPNSGKQIYAVTYKGGRTVYLHRLLMGEPGCDVDHVNRNGLDNRRANLRLATRSQNMANTASRKGSSRFKGVHWSTKLRKWQATIMVNGKSRYIGIFDDEKLAANAYNDAAKNAFGDFAYVNRT